MNLKAGVRDLVCCAVLLLSNQAVAAESNNDCSAHVGQWLDPDSGENLASDKLFERLANSRIVLLGEAHTMPAHHRWQHYMMAALHARKPNMVVGFEMLPRRVQDALDGWSQGKIDEQDFLQQSDWEKVWGYDSALYMPLLHFARLHRLPTLALNVDRQLVAEVGQKGWQALDESQRQGLSDPAPASEDYRDSLAELYAYKQTMGTDPQSDLQPIEAIKIDEIKRSEGFSNFVDAQLTWDRAMAEALAAAHRRDPNALVIGIIGRGHLEYGYGVPHQLADMGIDDVDVLLPIDADADCNPLPLDLASAVFIVDADGEKAEPPRARLGVYIETGDSGVLVKQVVADSVAEASGLREGDIIVSAAGFDTLTNTALIEIIQRQAPGTLLPLTLKRGDKEMELLARFPQSFE